MVPALCCAAHACVRVLQALERQLNEATGSRLDAYEIEAPNEKSDVLRDLAEFQLAAVRIRM